MRFETFRQVRVVVDGNPVRVHVDHGIQGLLKTGDGLVGQAVHQVHVDGLETLLTRLPGHLACQLFTLMAVDGFLYLGIDILDPETDAVEACLPQHAQLFAINRAWIDLDGILSTVIVKQGEMPGGRIH